MPKELVRWGILSAANIATRFVKSEAAVENSRILAIAARESRRAEEFARRHGIPKAYGSYDALLQNSDIDAVYIASVHNMHRPLILRSLEAGKHVLCEKPLCLNADEVRECMEAARKRGLFLMEAMNLPFLPAIQTVTDWIAAGKIGEIRLVRADFGFNAPGAPEGRLLNPALGGGAMLDIGVYTLHFACLLLGYDPDEVSGVFRHASTGADLAGAYSLLYRSGALAGLTCGVDYRGAYDGLICGTEGLIRITDFSWPRKAELVVDETITDTVSSELDDTGFRYEIREAVDCIRKGRMESEILSLWKSLRIAELMDRLR